MEQRFRTLFTRACWSWGLYKSWVLPILHFSLAISRYKSDGSMRKDRIVLEEEGNIAKA